MSYLYIGKLLGCESGGGALMSLISVMKKEQDCKDNAGEGFILRHQRK